MQSYRNWLLELARQFMTDEGSEDAAHDYDHLVRVIAIAEKIQSKEGGDLLTIWAGVAFHDIGQERERRFGGDHALIGAALAAELLKDSSFPQQSIPAVQQAIQEHRLTGGLIPQTLEGCILFDADKIDSLGAVGIGRLYCITGRYNQKVYAPIPEDIVEPVDPYTIRRLRRRPDYSPSIEFKLLFANLPERMTTNTGRKLAHERFAYMQEFFSRLRQEVDGKL